MKRIVTEQYRESYLQYKSATKAGFEVLAASETHQPPIHHYTDSTAQCLTLLHTMSGKHYRATRHGFRDEIPHAPTRSRVHSSAWLIKEYHWWVAYKCHAYRKLSLVAATVRSTNNIREFSKLETSQHISDETWSQCSWHT
jgi:hypothetical protein